MNDDELAAIKRRWSRYGGMGNGRSDEDYTDAGCRILLRIAWADIGDLLAAAGVVRGAPQPEATEDKR